MDEKKSAEALREAMRAGGFPFGAVAEAVRLAAESAEVVGRAMAEVMRADLRGAYPADVAAAVRAFYPEALRPIFEGAPCAQVDASDLGPM